MLPIMSKLLRQISVLLVFVFIWQQMGWAGMGYLLRPLASSEKPADDQGQNSPILPNDEYYANLQKELAVIDDPKSGIHHEGLSSQEFCERFRWFLRFITSEDKRSTQPYQKFNTAYIEATCASITMMAQRGDWSYASQIIFKIKLLELLIRENAPREVINIAVETTAALCLKYAPSDGLRQQYRPVISPSSHSPKADVVQYIRLVSGLINTMEKEEPSLVEEGDPILSLLKSGLTHLRVASNSLRDENFSQAHLALSRAFRCLGSPQIRQIAEQNSGTLYQLTDALWREITPAPVDLTLDKVPEVAEAIGETMIRMLRKRNPWQYEIFRTLRDLGDFLHICGILPYEAHQNIYIQLDFYHDPSAETGFSWRLIANLLPQNLPVDSASETEARVQRYVELRADFDQIATLIENEIFTAELVRQLLRQPPIFDAVEARIAHIKNLFNPWGENANQPRGSRFSGQDMMDAYVARHHLRRAETLLATLQERRSAPVLLTDCFIKLDRLLEERIFALKFPTAPEAGLKNYPTLLSGIWELKEENAQYFKKFPRADKSSKAAIAKTREEYMQTIELAGSAIVRMKGPVAQRKQISPPDMSSI